MNAKDGLRVDWCNAAASRYAVERWHYSKCMPRFKTVKTGVWEYGEFVGTVIFAGGATPQIGKPFGLKSLDVCELARVALRHDHKTPVTRIVAIALRMLRQQSPGIRIVVSFADEAQGHLGGIYQGGNWVYVGSCAPDFYKVHGELVHPKTLHSRYGRRGQSVPWLREHVDPKAERVKTIRKHKYVMVLRRSDPLGDEIAKMARPYPKTRAGSIGSDATAHHAVEGGATPTSALHILTAGVNDG